MRNRTIRNQIYVGPWRNSRFELYALACRMSELKGWDPKLYRLLETYGKAFDDEFCYYKGPRSNWVRKYPLWYSKGIKYPKDPTEKPKDPFLRTLSEFEEEG